MRDGGGSEIRRGLFLGGLSDLRLKPRFVLLFVRREEWWERKECIHESGE
jgi:hypothetical protein